MTLEYAAAAYWLGEALSADGGGPAVAAAERSYTDAMTLYPGFPDPYRELGVLLARHGGSPARIIALWRRFLALAPGAPQAPAIARALHRLEAGRRA
jgi:hypothetical protein